MSLITIIIINNNLCLGGVYEPLLTHTATTYIFSSVQKQDDPDTSGTLQGQVTKLFLLNILNVMQMIAEIDGFSDVS